MINLSCVFELFMVNDIKARDQFPLALLRVRGH